jgi:hypothetical protein
VSGTSNGCFWFSLAVAVSLAAAPGLRAQQRSVTVEDIAKIWEERQAKYKNVRIAWTSEYLFPKGSSSRVMPPGTFPDGAELPPTDHTFSAENVLIIEGDKYRYECRGYENWLISLKAYATNDSTTVFDGKTKTTKTEFRGQHKQGSIQEEKRPSDMQNSLFYPPMMAFRPVHPLFRSFDLQDFRLASQPTTVSGQSRLEAAKRVPAEKLVYSVWLDPTRDYLPVQFRTVKDGKLSKDIAIDYTRDADQGWLPQSWRVEAYGQGILFNSSRSRMTECVINERLARGTFALEFEARTYVMDDRSRRAYAVTDDLSKVDVPRGISKESLLELFESRRADRAVRSPRRWPWIVGAALSIGIAAVVVSILVRRGALRRRAL